MQCFILLRTWLEEGSLCSGRLEEAPAGAVGAVGVVAARGGGTRG